MVSIGVHGHRLSCDSIEPASATIFAASSILHMLLVQLQLLLLVFCGRLLERLVENGWIMQIRDITNIGYTLGLSPKLLGAQFSFSMLTWSWFRQIIANWLFWLAGDELKACKSSWSYLQGTEFLIDGVLPPRADANVIGIVYLIHFKHAMAFRDKTLDHRCIHRPYLLLKFWQGDFLQQVHRQFIVTYRGCIWGDRSRRPCAFLIHQFLARLLIAIIQWTGIRIFHLISELREVL